MIRLVVACLCAAVAALGAASSSRADTTCPPGQYATSDGCVCPSGQHVSDTGGCATDDPSACPAGQYATSEGCVCPAGQHPAEDGTCATDNEPAVGTSAVAGAHKTIRHRHRAAKKKPHRRQSP